MCVSWVDVCVMGLECCFLSYTLVSNLTIANGPGQTHYTYMLPLSKIRIKKRIKMFNCMAVLDRQIQKGVLHGSKLRTLFLFLLDTAMCRVYGAYLKNIVHLSILNQKRLLARR